MYHIHTLLQRILYGTYLMETIVNCILAYGTFEMCHKQECHRLAFYPQKPIMKYSSSLLVYIAELITFTCGI